MLPCVKLFTNALTPDAEAASGVEEMQVLGRSIMATLVAAVVLLVAAGCGGGDDPTAVPTQRPSPSVVPTAPVETTSEKPVETETGAGVTGTPVTSINRDIGGPTGEYKFDPGEFSFKVGDVVTFTLIAETEFHTFTVDDLGIDVAMDAGSSTTLNYTFDKAGEFKLVCIPHELNGMIGVITVVQ